ncbi:hypothetical protein A5906_36480 [Bradyrhizobium sacchari]|nr:DUF3298 and DUF4163 domain-containing protein [Bradyrhizobium sacchari]OPY97861.1 hypothetical protein A5906_36480 [Bradyrhizobium sacchari]
MTGLSVALALSVTCVFSALAADPKPDAVVKNKNIEARVLLDDTIRADPVLAADCLAEARKWLDKSAAEAAATRKTDPVLFRDGGWEFERNYRVDSVVAGRYVSLIRSDYTDTHGAHPNSDIDTILWDKTEGKRISIRRFFNETADNGPTMKAMMKTVIASLRIEKKKRDVADANGDDWVNNLKPGLLKIGAVTFAPSTEIGKSAGLSFHYPPYAVGPYVQGAYGAFVPWETLKPYLSPEGLRIFGGKRPKSDEDAQ